MREWTVIALLLVSCGGAPHVTRHLVTLPSDEEAAAYACRPGLVAIEVAGTRRRAESPEARTGVQLSDAALGPQQVLIGVDAAVRVGTDVIRLRETLVDESGAVLTTYEERGERGKTLAIVSDGRVAHRGRIELLDEPLRLTQRDGGWLFTYLSRRDDTLVVRSIGRDGTEVEVARVRGETRYAPRGVAVSSRGVVSIAYASERAVRFVRTPNEPPVEVDRDPSAASVDPVGLVAVDDGWWLVTELSWMFDVHFVARPPEWRFIHLDSSGAPTTRTIARGLGGMFDALLRVEGGRPIARFLAPDTREHFDVTVEARTTCDRTFGPCDPRTWPGPTAAHAHDPPVANTGPSEADCTAIEGGSIIVGVIDSAGLSLRDAEGRRLHTFRGHWRECQLVPLANHTVLVGTRWREDSVEVPETTVEAFVLSDRGRTIARHTAGSSGTRLRAARFGDGAAFVWSAAWFAVSWEFDALGRPRGPPRELASFYHSPRLELADTAHGPALLWSTVREHGVVPLCHTHSVTE
jgi:hypothetical protein